MADLLINIKTAGEEITIGALRRIGEVAINALGAAFGEVAKFAKSSFDGAIEAQQGMDRMRASIERLGAASPVTVAQAEALADQFKNLVGGSDDMVIAMQDVILRFDKIGSETFPRVIQQSADLATVLKMEPTRAAELLGKVLQDLSVDGVGSIGRLKAAGVQLSDEQEKLILQMVEMGDVAGAQNLLLDILAKTTGGAAAANAETLAGKWAIFKETMADAGEGIALKFLPVLSQLFDSVIAPALPIVEAFAGAIGTLVDEFLENPLEDPIGNVANAVFAFTTALGLSREEAVKAFDKVIALREPFEQLMQSLQPVRDAVLNVAAAFAEKMPLIQQYVQDMAAFVMQQVNTLSPQLIANISNTLNQLAEFWREHGDEIMAVVNFAFRVITATIGGALTLLTGLISTAMSIINGDWDAAWAAITGSLETFMQLALNIVGVNLDDFMATWRGNWELAKLIVTTVWGQIVEAVRSTISQFVTIGRGIIDGIISGIQSAVGALVDAAISAALAALAGAKAALGINSPSTVFAGIGANMMQGMALGIAGNAGLPAAAAVGAAGGIVNNFYGGISIPVSGAADPWQTADAVGARLSDLARNADGLERMR